MTKPLKLDRDGKLAIPEKGRTSVSAAIQQLLEADGWTVIWTPAEDVRRGSGVPSQKRYTLDGLAVKMVVDPDYADYEDVQLFFFELKARLAKTSKARLAGQTRKAEELRRRGFLVYQAEEDDPNPIENFRRWLRSNF